MYACAEIIFYNQIIHKKCNDFYGIYEVLKPLVGHDKASGIASWCENAGIGEGWEEENGLVVYIIQ